MSEPSEALLREMRDEQRKTNELLMMLIEALADEQDPDAMPVRYMDGSLIE